MTTIIETEVRVNAVHMDGLALLKIVKHCHESLPHLVSGSLLGLVVQKENTTNSSGNNNVDSVLEITYSFPFPSDQYNITNKSNNENNSNVDDDNNALVTTNTTSTASASSMAMAAATATVASYDGHEYQIEMMRMLREVNIDNNCIGWYQSIYLGLYNTISIFENQFNYQTELSSNSIVVLYDPIQTQTTGTLILKCYRLSDECIHQQEQLLAAAQQGNTQNSNYNTYIHPQNIFEEIPITFTNPGLIHAFLYDIMDGLHMTTTTTTTSSSASTNSSTTTASGIPIISSSSSSKGNSDNTTTVPTSSSVSSVSSSLQSVPVVTTQYHMNTSIYDTSLDLCMNPYIEKHLELLTNVVDELTIEQQKFIYYSKQLLRSATQKGNNSNNNNNNKKDKVLPMIDTNMIDQWIYNNDAPKRLDALLYNNQIHTYIHQLDTCNNDGFTKLFLTNGLQQQQQQLPTNSNNE